MTKCEKFEACIALHMDEVRGLDINHTVTEAFLRGFAYGEAGYTYTYLKDTKVIVLKEGTIK